VPIAGDASGIVVHLLWLPVYLEMLYCSVTGPFYMYRMSHCIVLSLKGCHNVMTKTQIKLSIGLAYTVLWEILLHYTITYGSRSFVSEPRVWNDLPPTLRSSSTTLGHFQSRLKTTMDETSVVIHSAARHDEGTSEEETKRLF